MTFLWAGGALCVLVLTAVMIVRWWRRAEALTDELLYLEGEVDKH